MGNKTIHLIHFIWLNKEHYMGIHKLYKSKQIECIGHTLKDNVQMGLFLRHFLMSVIYY